MLYSYFNPKLSPLYSDTISHLVINLGVHAQSYSFFSLAVAQGAVSKQDTVKCK